MTSFTISQPKTFSVEVAIPQLGGEPINVPFEFNIFTREELAKIQDEWVIQEPQPLDADLSNLDYVKKLNALKAKQIKQLVASWGFDDPYNDKSITKLINTIIGSDEAIVRTYFSELTKARLGN